MHFFRKFAAVFLKSYMIKEKFTSALIATLFMAVFQPFGLTNFGPKRWLLLSGIWIVITIACVSSEYMVRYVFRMPVELAKRSPQYAIRRGFAYQACNIPILSFLTSFYLDHFACSAEVDNHLSWRNYLWILAICITLSFIIGLYWRNVYLKRFYIQQLEEAQVLNGILMERSRQENMQSTDSTTTTSIEPKKEAPLLLEGTTKERLSLHISDFLYAESEGNYVSIHYLKQNECKQTALRTSMKNIISILCALDNVMQCHRAFVINLDMVAQVNGRSSGISLEIKHCNASIPVSKAYASEVKERIRNPRHSSQ